MQNYLISGLAPKKVSIFLSLSSYLESDNIPFLGSGCVTVGHFWVTLAPV